MSLANAIGMEKETVVANKKKWIKGAIRHPGALKRAAKRAGESTKQYADKHKHDSGKTGQRARLAETLMGMH